MPMTNQHIVTIEKAAYEGYGIAYIDGKVIFVEGGIPNEKVSIEIIKNNKDYSFAKIVSVIEESQHRILPLCPIFDLCGGCSYQNVSYEFELELKKNILIDSLKRIGKIPENDIPEIETIFSERFFYRSHGRFFVEDNIGFMSKKSHQFIALPQTGCLIMHPKINDFIKNNSLNDDVNELKIAISSQDEVYTSNSKKEFCELELGFKYMRNIDNFFQSNIYLRGKMIEKVIEYSMLNKNDTFIDIGCGIGFFTIPLAKISKYGIGVDIDFENIEAAKKNCIINEVSNLDFLCDNFNNVKFDFAPKTIVLDPPRSGLKLAVISSIVNLKPSVIVYVSCNPSTFARDLKIFRSHNYCLEKLDILDCFPCTQHIEIIGKLVLD